MVRIEVPADAQLPLRAAKWATHAEQLGTTSIDLPVMEVGGEPPGRSPAAGPSSSGSTR